MQNFKKFLPEKNFTSTIYADKSNLLFTFHVDASKMSNLSIMFVWLSPENGTFFYNNSAHADDKIEYGSYK